MLCDICLAPATNRRIRVSARGEKARYGPRPLCGRCDVIRQRKPTPSHRGRQKNRPVPAPTTEEWISALHRSWMITGDCFRCELSGLRLNLDDPHSPLSMSCDHDPPGSGAFLIVAWVINDMKNDHDRIEFVRNIKALADVLATGAPDPQKADAVTSLFSGLNHWRRK